jgi:hypothetical protein
LIFHFYGFFFRSSSASTAPTTIMATMTPTIAGMKYRSAIDGAGVGAGVAVATAGSTANAATACEA